MPQSKRLEPPEGTNSGTDDSAAPIARWEATLAAFILFCTVCCVFAPSLFYGQGYYWGDIGLFFLPLNHFLKDQLSQGVVPLWNPYLYCGAPFVGNPQVTLLYPSTVLLPFMSALTAIMIAEAGHIFAAGLFFWFFARRGSLRLPFIPSLLSAVVYMLGGYFIAKSQFPNMLAALTYVPLLLYQTELSVRNPTLKRSAVFGAVLGLQLLAGHTQITVFSLYLMIPYAVLIYSTATDRPVLSRLVPAALTGAVLATGLACAYWLPTAQLIQASARQALTLRVANRFYLPWYQLADFVAPHLFGSPMRGDWHAHGNYWETDNYVGLVPFVLAVFATVQFVRGRIRTPGERRQFVFWATVFVVSTWLSLGSKGYLYRLAFVVLPALKAFHDPARLMLGADVALALFAGAGASMVTDRLAVKPKAWVAAALLLISALDLGWHDRGIYPVKPVAKIQEMTSSPVISYLRTNEPALGASRVLMPDSQRSWRSFTTYRSYEQNDPTFLTEWPDTVCPCLNMTDGLLAPGGYDPEYRRDSQELLDLAQSPITPTAGKQADIDPSVSNNLAPYMAMIGVKYLLTFRVDDIQVPDLSLVDQSQWQRRKKRVRIYQNDAYRSRAGLYEVWSTVSSQEAELSVLQQRLRSASSGNPFSAPVLEGNSGGMPPRPSMAQSVVPQPVTFLVDSADDVVLRTPPIATDVVLVLADTLHPGWSATIDGIPARLFRANGDQRAVYVPREPSSKPHTIAFRYRPADFRIGVYVTLISLLAILIVIVGGRDKTDALKAVT